MRVFFRVILYLLTIVTALLLLLTDIMSYVQPSTTLYTLCPITIFFSSFVVLTLFLCIYWVFRRKWFIVALCMASLLVSTPNLLKTYSFIPSYETMSVDGALSVMSYNVQLFSWFEGERGIDKANKTLDYIAAADADVVCLQEFLYYNEGTYTLDYINQRLSAYPYSYIEILNLNKKVRKCIATYSKYPITEKKLIKFSTPYHGAIVTSINANGTTYNVINCYLRSNQLTEKEKDLTPDYIGGTKPDKSAQGIFSAIYNKLVKASLERCSEAEIVASEVDKINRNMIVCGDMNDIPASYVYRTMKGYLNDSFLLMSRGGSAGYTFHEGIYNFRIDYIFISDNIIPCEFSIERQPMSDHYPIVLKIAEVKKRVKL